MSIKDLFKKIKGFPVLKASKLPQINDDLFLAFVISLVAFGSFGLGRLSVIDGVKTPIQIENLKGGVATPKNTEKGTETEKNSTFSQSSSELVGSKNGTKYYYPWCSGVKNISPANLIHFASKTDAEARGYTPSATCKGL